jgi:stage V sporulation protein R
VKEALLKNVGMGTIPIIKVEDADYDHNRILYLKHSHDGRDLQVEYAERTLAHLHQLWGYETMLETTLSGKKVVLSYSDKGFSTKPA